MLITVIKCDECSYEINENRIIGLEKFYNETELIRCLDNNTESDLFLEQFVFQPDIIYDFNVFMTRSIKIENSNLEELVKADQNNDLKIYEIKSCKLIALQSYELLPFSIEIINFTGNKIAHIESEFFKKFKNLSQVDLSHNFLFFIDLLTFDSKSIFLIKLNYNNLIFLKKIQFKNSKSHPKFMIDLRHNYLRNFPKMIGKLSLIPLVLVDRQENLRMIKNSLNSLTKEEKFTRIDFLVMDYAGNKEDLDLFKKKFSVNSIILNDLSLSSINYFNTDWQESTNTTEQLDQTETNRSNNSIKTSETFKTSTISNKESENKIITPTTMIMDEKFSSISSHSLIVWIYLLFIILMLFFILINMMIMIYWQKPKEDNFENEINLSLVLKN